MPYKPSHAKRGSLARFAARGGVIAGAAALAAATAGSLAPVAANAATTTYTESGNYQFASNEANGNWQMSDSPITNDAGTETLGANGVTLTATGDNSQGYGTAEIVYPLGKLSSLFTDGKFTPPTVDSTGSTPYVNYYADANGDGEPLSFSYNGATYEGPGGDNLFTLDSSRNVDLNGWQQGNDLLTQGMSMSDVLAAFQGRTSGTTNPEVWAAIGVQSMDSSTVTATVTSVNGTDLVQATTAPTLTFPSEPAQNATEGKAFDLNDPAAVDPAGTAVTYKASGLPDGVSIDSATGEISGTPSAAGQYAVTVAGSAAGAKTAYQHFVMDVAFPPTWTASTNGGVGRILNAYSGKYMNVMASTYATGSKIAQWDAAGASHEKFQVVTLTGSDGTKAGYLEAIAPNGSKWFVVASGGGQLALGGQAPAYLTDASAEGATIAESPEDMLKSGSYYTFPNDGGKVADDSKQSLKNGAPVIAFAQNGGKNQQWSLP